MTAIVAVEHSGRVYIGADSAATEVQSLGIEARLDKKIFTNNGYLVGFAGDYRAGQIVKHRFELPDFPSEFLPANYCPEILPEDICLENLPEKLILMVENFFAISVIDAIKFAYEESGYLLNDEYCAEFVIAIGPYFVFIGSDFQVGIISGYTAIGSGGAVALGALAITEHMPPDKRLELALEVSAKHNAGVRAPFHIHST